MKKKSWKDKTYDKSVNKGKIWVDQAVPLIDKFLGIKCSPYASWASVKKYGTCRERIEIKLDKPCDIRDDGRGVMSIEVKKRTNPMEDDEKSLKWIPAGITRVNRTILYAQGRPAEKGRPGILAIFEKKILLELWEDCVYKEMLFPHPNAGEGLPRIRTYHIPLPDVPELAIYFKRWRKEKKSRILTRKNAILIPKKQKLIRKETQGYIL